MVRFKRMEHGMYSGSAIFGLMDSNTYHMYDDELDDAIAERFQLYGDERLTTLEIKHIRMVLSREIELFAQGSRESVFWFVIPEDASLELVFSLEY